MRRLNVIIFDHYTRVRHGVSVRVVSRKSSTSVSRSTGFFRLLPSAAPPLLLLLLLLFPFRGRNVLRGNSRDEPTSEPLVPPSSAATAVRHGVNRETRRSESDTLPLSCVPPCVEAGETRIRACAYIHVCGCACACSLVRANASTLLH